MCLARDWPYICTGLLIVMYRAYEVLQIKASVKKCDCWPTELTGMKLLLG